MNMFVWNKMNQKKDKLNCKRLNYKRLTLNNNKILILFIFIVFISKV